MALLLNDGFGLYDTAAGALQIKGWTTTGGPNLFSGGGGMVNPGRVSTSRGISMNGGQFGGIRQTIPFSGSTTTVGLAWKVPSSGSGGGTESAIISHSSNSAPGEVSVRRVEVSTGVMYLRVYKDATLLASVGPFSTVTWYYIEVQVTWAAAGRVVVRVDGSVQYDSGAGGVVLPAPNTGLLLILSSGGQGQMYAADLLVMDASGSTFNGFQGDVTIETLFPTADGATSGWTPAYGNLTIIGRQLFSNVAQVYVSGSTAIPAGTTITVTGVGAPFDGTWTTTANGGNNLSYAVTNANIAFASSGGAISTAAIPARWEAVDEAPMNNADADYVTTATVGAVDTYVMQDLATSAASPVLAVRPVLIARKESAATMGIAAVARSAGTDYPGTAGDLPNTLVYVPWGDTLVVDPATGSAWTRAAVNAIEIGPKKTA